MNKYEIDGIIGEGAYGIVYKAQHKDNNELGKSGSTINDKLVSFHIFLFPYL